MKKIYILLFINLLSIYISAQTTKNVLFLGNSYTEVNNLPNLVKNMAISVGNTVNFDSNTPGGHTLQGHWGNGISKSKIEQGNWDFVVLQEQSQIPSFPDNYVNNNMFPYAKKLDSLINKNNPCAETIFYMTWGRKNGDAGNCAANPVVCTYQGMDNAIKTRYEMMALQNNGIMSPVGAVWRYIRNNYPNIELYSSDESHPSLAGSYAAACAFYTVIFRENPSLIPYTANLDPTTASQIREAAKTVVFDQLLTWNVGKYDLNSNFSSSVDANNPQNIQFYADYPYSGVQFLWNFGDGQSSTDKNPLHNFNSPGIFPVELKVSRCGKTSVKTMNITVNSLKTEEIANPELSIYPNPVKDFIQIKNGKNIDNFEIFDASGRLIIQNKLNNNTIKIDELNPGNYFLQLKDRNQKIILSSKFIKE